MKREETNLTADLADVVLWRLNALWAVGDEVLLCVSIYIIHETSWAL